jgi:hypothetical protein
MQRKLPRELRDIIYEYVLGDSDVDIKAPDVKLLPCRPRHIALGEKFDDKAFYHLCKPSFLDPQTMREFAECWYRRSMFNFDCDITFRKFMRRNMWHFGLLVVDLVRRVKREDRTVVFVRFVETNSVLQL